MKVVHKVSWHVVHAVEVDQTWPGQTSAVFGASAIHLSFDLAVTPGRREGGAAGCIIATNACGKALEFDNPALFCLDEPAIQITASSLSQQQHKPLAEIVRRFQVGMTCSDILDVLLLLLIKLGGLKQWRTRFPSISSKQAHLMWG